MSSTGRAGGVDPQSPTPGFLSGHRCTYLESAYHSDTLKSIAFQRKLTRLGWRRWCSSSPKLRAKGWLPAAIGLLWSLGENHTFHGAASPSRGEIEGDWDVGQTKVGFQPARHGAAQPLPFPWSCWPALSTAGSSVPAQVFGFLWLRVKEFLSCL